MIPCTNLTDETVYKKYHTKVNSCKERHNDASEENKKEMITALIKNLGKHPTREVTQHQIEMLQSEVKSMPESGRRDFDGYLTQVAKARVDLLKSIAKCNRMHMLRKECITDSVNSNKRTFGDVEEEERSFDYDRERDQERNRDRNRDREQLSKCNHHNNHLIINTETVVLVDSTTTMAKDTMVKVVIIIKDFNQL